MSAQKIPRYNVNVAGNYGQLPYYWKAQLGSSLEMSRNSTLALLEPELSF